MDIQKNLQDEKLIVKVTGRLDTNTSPELDASLLETQDGYKTLVLDFSELAYISSAGLRILLSTQKRMTAGGNELIVSGVGDEIYEIFEITGFSDILKVERK